jgi:hypothetical protein
VQAFQELVQVLQVLNVMRQSDTRVNTDGWSFMHTCGVYSPSAY